MKFLVFTLVAVFVVSHAQAEIDESYCRQSSMMKLMELQCISCGVQKYYQEKQGNADDFTEVVPSDRWLALLALSTRNHVDLLSTKESNPAQTGDNSDSIVTNPAARAVYQKSIIAKIQAYGFCTQQIAKSDMKSEDWALIREAITGRRVSDDKLDKIAKELGFSSPSAGAKLKELIDNTPIAKLPFPETKQAFKDKLKKALSPQFDKSGEKKHDAPTAILQDGESRLRTCLEEVDRNINGKGGLAADFMKTDKESIAICKAMQKACDLEGNICAKKGMEGTVSNGKPTVIPVAPSQQRPVAPPQPPTMGGKPSQRPPPPPNSRGGLDDLPDPGAR